jgi:ElaB/YqjD/DUF883 family membrane-anchored ribosome-binding protein
MDTVNNFTKHAASGVDTAANRLHDGIHAAEDKARGLGADAAERADSAVNDAQGRIKDGIQDVKRAVKQARDGISNSTDSIIAYTQENPVKALLIAAASGAALWTLARLLATSRD